MATRHTTPTEEAGPPELRSPASLADQARAAVVDILEREKLPPGSRLPSVRQISAAIGISRATVAKTLADMTREGLFISRQGKGIYVNGAEHGDRAALEVIYCLVCASHVRQAPQDYLVHSAFWSQTLAGVGQGLRDRESEIPLRFSFTADFLAEKTAGPRRRRWNRIGLIVLGDPRPEQWKKLMTLRASMVVVHGLSRTDRAANVRVDSALGAAMLVDHLVTLGHRRIAFCGSLETHQGIDYEKSLGFREAAVRHGLMPDDRRLFLPCGPSLEEGYRVAQILLSHHPRPTAAVLVNDDAAIGAMRAVCDAGLSVPKDLSIAGFDNIATGSYVIPSLTTVSVRMAELGRLSVDRLFAVHQHNDRSDQILRPELIVRESTAPATQETV